MLPSPHQALSPHSIPYISTTTSKYKEPDGKKMQIWKALFQRYSCVAKYASNTSGNYAKINRTENVKYNCPHQLLPQDNVERGGQICNFSKPIEPFLEKNGK